MKVVDPQGRTWRVSRRWMPWRRKSSTGDWGSPGPGFSPAGDDPVSAVLGCLGLVLFFPFVVLSVVVAFEMLLLLLLLPFAILARMLFGSHWRVEVREGWDFAWELEAGGWSESGRMIEHVAQGLRMGLSPWRAAEPRPPVGRSPIGQPPPGQPPPPSL